MCYLTLFIIYANLDMIWMRKKKERVSMKHIYVVGSMSMDLVVSTDQVPSKGETVLGNTFSLHQVVKARIKQWQQQG